MTSLSTRLQRSKLQKYKGVLNMRKTIVLILTILLMIALPTLALADTGGTATAQSTITDVLIESGVEIVSAFFIALIGAFGAWLTLKLGQNAKLSSIHKAQQEVIALTQQTVGELQQTVVDGLKAAHKDGKLTENEIKALGTELLDKTVVKLSTAAVNLLEAAKVDVSALITGAAESWIAGLKQ